MCFQFTHFHCDDCERIYTLSYHHHQIGSMNYYPLFRVRSWNNGMRCMSLYSYEIQHKFTNQSKRSSGWQPWNSLRTLKRAFKVSSEYQGCTLMTFPFQWSDVSFGAISILRCHFIAIVIPIINVRRTHDGFIFINGNPMPEKDGLYVLKRCPGLGLYHASPSSWELSSCSQILHWMNQFFNTQRYGWAICSTMPEPIYGWFNKKMWCIFQKSFVLTVKYRVAIRYYIAHPPNMNCTDSIYLWRLLFLCMVYVFCLSSADRLSDFIVTVSISFPVTSDELQPPAFIRCGQYQGYPGPGQTGTVTCNPGPSRGRYVFISLPTLGILTICETRVFAGRSRMALDNAFGHSHVSIS